MTTPEEFEREIRNAAWADDMDKLAALYDCYRVAHPVRFQEFVDTFLPSEDDA